MDSRALTLGVVAGLAVAGFARRASGSRSAFTPTETTGLVIGTSALYGTPIVLLVDLSVLRGVRSASQLQVPQGRFTDEEAARLRIPAQDAILAFIETSYPFNEFNEITEWCNGNEGVPLQVKSSVAQKGWGPLVYDAALWVVAQEGILTDYSTWSGYSGYLMPDRGCVFEGAQDLWAFYFANRKSDVASKKIPKECPHHASPVLDRMYKAKLNRPAFAGMDAMHQRWVAVRSDMEERLGMDGEAIEAKLVEMGEWFFDSST